MIFAQDPESFVWRLKWNTDIIKAYDGSEQRSSNDTIPIDEYEVDLIVDLDEIRALRLSFFTEPAAIHEMVAWQDETTVVDSTASNNIHVPALSSDLLAFVNARLIIRVPGEDDHVATVTNATADGDNYVLTVSPSPPATHRVDNAVVLPLIKVYLNDNVTTGRWRLDDGARLSMSLVGKDPFETPGLGAALPDVFDGYYVLDRPSSIEDEGVLQEQNQGGLSGLDEPGPVYQNTGWNFSDIVREAKFSWNTDAERQFWKKFLYAVDGRRVPFLYPTWRPDLELAVVPNDSDTTLVINTTPDFLEWYEAPSHKRLALMLSDGTFIPVKVTDVTDNLDDTLTLDLDDSIDIPPGLDVEYVSFLETVRLGRDVIEVNLSQGQGFFDLPMVVIQDT